MLKIEYKSNFKGKDTLHLAGDAWGVGLIYNFISNWKGQTTDLLLWLKEQGVNVAPEIHSLILTDSTKENRMDQSHKEFIWQISTEKRSAVIDLLDGLMSSAASGHQYLDDGFGNTQIIISKDEY